jgi:RNA polymerase sigma-70 factor (ECF subfamily)
MMQRKQRSPEQGPVTHNAVGEDLVAQARGGNRAALDRLLGLLEPGLFLLAIRRLGNDADARDVVQETLLKIFLGLASFDPARGCLSWWAIRICRNEVVNVFRRKRGRTPHPLDCEGLAGREDPVGSVEIEEIRALLRAAVNELPADEKAAVTMHFVEERTYKEAAATLGVPMATVAGRTYRGLSLLRRRLRKAV